MPDDAFGRMVWDYYHDQLSAQPVYRWSDGTAHEADPAEYFRPPDDWTPWIRERLTEVTGPTLDLGCGAGRHALWVQHHDTEVVAIDRSPRALAVARHRGVEQCVTMDMRVLGVHAESFASVIVIGDQLGLGGSLARFKALLESLASILTQEGYSLVISGCPPEERRTETGREPRVSRQLMGLILQPPGFASNMMA